MSERKPFDRFDFEQQILRCWNLTSDIKDLLYFVESDEHDVKTNQVFTILRGLEQLYELRFQALMEQFERLVYEHAETLDKSPKKIPS